MKQKSTVDEHQSHRPKKIIGAYLAFDDATHIAREVAWKIGVGTSNVRVDVMAHDVLVEPRRHVSAGKPVHGTAADQTPAGRALRDGGVRRVMHDVKQWQRLAHTVEDSPQVLRERVARDEQVHAHVRQRRQREHDGHAPQPREAVLRVQLVLLEVFSDALAALLVKARVRLVHWELGLAHELANAVLVENLVGAVAERMVRHKRIGALATGVKQDQFTAARMLVRPLCECKVRVTGQSHRHDECHRRARNIPVTS